MQRAWVQSLVGELRSDMPRGPKNQNLKHKQYCNKFNKDFLKNGPYQKKIFKKKERKKPKYELLTAGTCTGTSAKLAASSRRKRCVLSSFLECKRKTNTQKKQKVQKTNIAIGSGERVGQSHHWHWPTGG